MLATRPAHRALSTSGSIGLSHMIDALVGSALELVVHSVESLRERFTTRRVAPHLLSR
jgi:hypothetical protein